jgi:hypothetical protein
MRTAREPNARHAPPTAAIKDNTDTNYINASQSGSREHDLFAVLVFSSAPADFCIADACILEQRLTGNQTT